MATKPPNKATTTPPRKPVAQPATPSTNDKRPATSKPKPVVSGGSGGGGTTPKPAAKPAVKPTAKVPSVMVSIKGPDGKVKRVAMAKPKAIALAKKRAAARNTSKTSTEISDVLSLIPGAFRDYVDPKSIDAAVNAQINSLNIPLDARKANAAAQAATNQHMAASLAAQSQATMDTLVGNANSRTAGFQQLSGQAIAQQAAVNKDAAAAMQGALGTAYNPQIAALTAQGMAPLAAAQQAGGVQNTWAQTLASGAQADFFQRGKALAALGAQNFNTQQQKQLGQVVNLIDAEKAANSAKRAALIADTASSQAQFGLSAQTAAQAFGQQAIENAQKDRALATGEASVVARENASKRTAATSTANAQTRAAAAARAAQAKAAAALTKEQRSLITKAHKAIDERAAQIGKPFGSAKDPKTGQPLTYTASDVFGKGNGPWRVAFDQLTSPEIGMDANTAAMYATSWYKASIKGKDYKNIAALLNNRGVTGATYNTIMHMTDPNSRPVQGPPAPATAAEKAAQKANVAAHKMQSLYAGKEFRIPGGVEKMSRYRVISVTVDGDKLVWKVRKTSPLAPDANRTYKTKIGATPDFIGG